MSIYTKEMQSALDIDWFAVDSSGNIAHFASGGGRLPFSIANAKEDNEFVGEFIRENITDTNDFLLSAIAKEKMLTKNTEEAKWYLNDFQSMSKRGLFSYDKSALGDFRNEEYHLITSPTMPIDISQIPFNIASIINATKISGDFRERLKLNIVGFLTA